MKGYDFAMALHPIEASVLHARRERVFLVLSGLFLGTLAMLNILGILRFIKLGELETATWGTPFWASAAGAKGRYGDVSDYRLADSWATLMGHLEEKEVFVAFAFFVIAYSWLILLGLQS